MESTLKIHFPGIADNWLLKYIIMHMEWHKLLKLIWPNGCCLLLPTQIYTL